MRACLVLARQPACNTRACCMCAEAVEAVCAERRRDCDTSMGVYCSCVKVYDVYGVLEMGMEVMSACSPTHPGA